MAVKLDGMASKRQITVGGVEIGGGAPVVVQSMTLTKTHDVEATTAQIAALASAGCEIVRVAVPKSEDADALPLIVRLSPLPVIADIHFNASLALRAIEARRRGRPDQPGQHRRARQGRAGRQGREEGRHPDADRRQLGLAPEAPRGAGPEGPGRGARRPRRSRRSSCSRSSTSTTSRSRSSRATCRR